VISLIIVIERNDMEYGLVVPPLNEVRGIVLDMLPCVRPKTEPTLRGWSVFMAMSLVLLCAMAQKNKTTKAVFAQFMNGMLQSGADDA